MTEETTTLAMLSYKWRVSRKYVEECVKVLDKTPGELERLGYKRTMDKMKEIER